MSSAQIQPLPETATPTPGRRAESEAVYAALAAGALGAVYGLFVGLFAPKLQLGGNADSFAVWAACGAAVVGAVIATLEYWRARNRPGQEWRRSLGVVLVEQRE